MSKISDQFQRVRTLYKNHLWQGRLILASLITLIVLVVVRISLPHTIVYSAVYWLGQQGIASQIEDIQINITEGTFAIINASGIKDGETVFKIGTASIDWQWRPLAEKTIHIKQVRLEEFDMQAAQYSDALVIAGITIRKDGEIEEPPVEAKEEDTVAWGAALEQIDFEDLAFCFQQYGNALDHSDQNKLIDYCGNIGLFSWQGEFDFGSTVTAAQVPETMLFADGSLKIEQVAMHNNLLDGALVNIGIAQFSTIKINGINDIHLDAISITKFTSLQGSGHSSHQHAVEFNALDISGITLNDTNALEINEISLDKPVASIAKDKAGAWKYEQWLLQQAKATSSSEPEPGTSETNQDAFRLMLGNVSVTDAEACYQQPDLDGQIDISAIDYCLTLASTNWNGRIDIRTATDNQPVQFNINGELDLANLSASNNVMEKQLLALTDLKLSNIKVDGINSVHLDALNINQFALLQDSGHSRHKHAVEFNKLEITDINLNDAKSLDISAITLQKPVISVAKDKTGAWKFERWMLQQDKGSDSSETEAEARTADKSTLNLKLGNITIANAEACYQQPVLKGTKGTGALDYCLNLIDAAWRGDIGVTTQADNQPLKLDVNGDLGLASFNTSNQILNRDLVTFKKLAINKLNVKGVEDLAFEKLDLDNVAGLELTSAENKHTVTVSNLDVSAFNYRNNALAIDKVAITDLGLDVTQNEDGTLDFEQWKIESAEDTTTDKPEPTESKAEAIKIKLGEFNLDTSRIVQFTDLSVTPSMQIGFSKIHVNIKDLDSEKPQQKSPIELAAKTMRHGTLEIKGVAMPFDAKPSFDATGKITGIDLRVASPKAEQTIGHIIKSGQLDADIKLLSEQGKLDSNIALVLHHFNLKAKSKEDAAALDKTFGMPINQSLVLLKDKKGRIKLDIPITGDIYDPSFDPTDAIVKATAKATTVTLITFYTPYGLAFAGGNVLFNLATAMNFDPLMFDAGSSQLTDAHKQQLAKLAELLVERPAVHLTLCGYTNLKDRDKLFSEIIDPKKIKPVSAERLVKLKQLGSERQDSVKNYLIDAGKIAHNRLILCEPEHGDDAESIAGVEISI